VPEVEDMGEAAEDRRHDPGIAGEPARLARGDGLTGVDPSGFEAAAQ